jgi:hypothetical protein
MYMYVFQIHIYLECYVLFLLYGSFMVLENIILCVHVLCEACEEVLSLPRTVLLDCTVQNKKGFYYCIQICVTLSFPVEPLVCFCDTSCPKVPFFMGC